MDMGKMFAVVEFRDEMVEVIPSAWVTEDRNHVLWPSTFSRRRQEKAIMGCMQPEEDWALWPVKRIFATSDSFQKARKKANNALYTSNVSDSSDGGTQKRQAKRPARFNLSEDEREIEAPAREETTRYVTPDIPAFPCHNNAAKNNEEDGVPSRDSNSQVLKCLAKLTYEVQHLRKELLAIKNSNKCACNGSSSPAPQLKSTLPLSTEEEMAIMCDEVKEGMGMDALVNTLSVAGGDTLVKVVGNIMRKLITNDLAKGYSACGKKGKKSLVALPVYTAIESAVRKNIIGATDCDVRAKVSRYLACAVDREGGRKER